MDEKDIQTGQSIDASIKKHLKECQDFLIIISPASLKSEWVLLELGGAITLEKNIIPIMLYVGINELPHVINLKLARDINDIVQYYQEIAVKIEAAKPKHKRPTSKVPIKKARVQKWKPKFKPGQAVRIISHKPKDAFKDGLLIDWEDDMSDFMGAETIIRGTFLDGTYLLDIDKEGRGEGFVWAEEWLIPVNSLS